MTVLIAAYNAESFLRRAVNSALQQTFGVLEILIVDDASTDATTEVAKQLALEDSRVRLIELAENAGPAAARNVGFDCAAGQWVAILDADDAYVPARMEQMLQTAIDGEADIVADIFRYYDPSTGLVAEPALEERGDSEAITLLHFLEKARPLAGEADWGLLKPMFRKAFLEEAGLRYPLYSRHGEDYLLLVEALLRGARYLLLRRAGYLYTNREAGLSRTTLNYPLMWRHTENLMTDPRIAADPALVAQLQERAFALKKYSAECDLTRMRRERDYVSIGRRLLADQLFRAMFREKLGRRLLL